MTKRKYPLVTSTTAYGMTYAMLYFVTYMVAAATYGMIMQVPADQSRTVSWIYYGAWFAVVPYVGTGLLACAYAVRSGKPVLACVHALLATQLIDKLGVPFLAAIIASGFPAGWYGRVFPYSGYRLLCEELPFYCGNYVQPYLLAQTIAGAAVIVATVYLFRGVRERVA